MKKLFSQLSPYKALALILTLLLLFFSIFVFYTNLSNKNDLVKAKVTEILELEDDQGLIYQNFLVRINAQNLTVKIKIPVNLSEVRNMEKGDSIYLQMIEETAGVGEYIYASTDKTLEFGMVLVGFLFIIISILGVRNLQNLFPAIIFLVLLVAGMFSLSTEVRFVFLSILGFLIILSFISMLWFYEDLFLGVISSLFIGLSLIFSVLLHTILINYTNSAEPIQFTELFGTKSVINDFDQAKLLVGMIFSYGLLVHVYDHLIKSMKKYKSEIKKVTKHKFIKFAVDTVQVKISRLLNLVFFLALGLNFLGLVSEDYAMFKYIWNNSFFISVVIDGVVAGITLIVGGYVMALILAIYLSKTDSVEPNKKK